MDQEDVASVFSLSLHRLQRAPRAIHRVILSRESLFRLGTNIEGTYFARAISFLRDELMAETCSVQMISKAQRSILFVGSLNDSLVGPALKALASENPQLRIHHFNSRNGERLLVVDGQTAVLGAGHLQFCVDGDIARALAQNYISVDSWTTRFNVGSTWPFHARLDLEAIEVALSRTLPVMKQSGAIEIERLTLKALRSARRFIFIETEALTSPVMIKALKRRLATTDGPEVILILPFRNSEETTSRFSRRSLLDGLQAHAIAEIETSDAYDKFRCYQRPATFSLRGHAKPCHIMIVDDQFVKIGTSTMTSRSLGASYETDLSIEAVGRTSVVMAIARVRRELLGSMLGVEPSEFDARFLLNGQLGATIESFFRSDRMLNTVRGAFASPRRVWISQALDPKRARAMSRWCERKLQNRSEVMNFAVILLIFFALFAMIR